MFITESVSSGALVRDVPGLASLVSQAPFQARPFPCPGLPFPVHQMLYGMWPNIGVLLKHIKETSHQGAGRALLEGLALAESIESERLDSARLSFSPETVDSLGDPPPEHAAGWVLLMGQGDRNPMAAALAEARYRVFCTAPEPVGCTRLGARDTSAVYFAQALMVRAATVGKVAPGDLDALRRFLRYRTSAFLVVCGALSPVEQVLAGALLRMGLPGIVPPEFGMANGKVAHARDPRRVLTLLGRLPSARVALHQRRLVHLPASARLDLVEESFRSSVRFGATRSFIHVTASSRKDDVVCSGTLKPGADLGVSVRVSGVKLDEVSLATIETRLAGLIDQLPGVRVAGRRPLALECASADALSAPLLAELVHAGMRIHYSQVPGVHVTVTADPADIDDLLPGVRKDLASRDRAMRKLAKTPPDYFVGCTGCWWVHDKHCCIITPETAPQCGLVWDDMHTLAELTAEDDPPTFNNRNFILPVKLFRRGRRLGSTQARGEYAGANDMVERLTGAEVTKVWLHSLVENPPTTSSQFEVLAFFIRGMEGIGLVDGNWTGMTPEGRTAGQLAEDATGMQRPGVRGLGLDYLAEPHFLAADGGWNKVVWINSALKRTLLKAGLEQVRELPTEKNAIEQDKLIAWYGRTKKKPRQSTGKTSSKTSSRKAPTSGSTASATKKTTKKAASATTKKAPSGKKAAPTKKTASKAKKPASAKSAGGSKKTSRKK